MRGTVRLTAIKLSDGSFFARSSVLNGSFNWRRRASLNESS